MGSVFSTNQPLFYAELSDVEKKTTILLQTQITSEELTLEAKVCCEHHGGGAQGVGTRLGDGRGEALRVGYLRGGWGRGPLQGVLEAFPIVSASGHQCI